MFKNCLTGFIKVPGVNLHGKVCFNLTNGTVSEINYVEIVGRDSQSIQYDAELNIIDIYAAKTLGRFTKDKLIEFENAAEYVLHAFTKEHMK